MRVRVMFGAGLAVLLLGVPAAGAGAATIEVNPLEFASGADCVLRDAITAANDDEAARACPAGDEARSDKIVITEEGVLTLGDALPDIRSDLSIEGPGSHLLEIDASDAIARVFTLPEDFTTVSMSGLTAAEGLVDDLSEFGPQGGGIYNAGVLTLDDVDVANNRAEDSETDEGSFAAGGGIFNASTGDLTVRNSEIAINEVDSATTSTAEAFHFAGAE